MKRRSTLAYILVAIALGASGCAHPSSASSTEVTVAGSTALLPLVKQAAADYEAMHPQAKISVSGGGSGVGITQAAQNGVDIGDSDILAPSEPSLIDHRVAVVKFVVIVNPATDVSALTTKQIADIFSGRVTNWKAVGGADQPITIVNRPRSSGTRTIFVAKLMKGEQPTDDSLTQDSSGTVASIVAQTPSATSYISSGYVRSAAVTSVSIDGVAPTTANVINGRYPFWSYEHMFTNGKPREAVTDFIDFVIRDRTALGEMDFLAPSVLKAPRT